MIQKNGTQCVMTPGTVKMLKWSVVSWDIQPWVRSSWIFITRYYQAFFIKIISVNIKTFWFFKISSFLGEQV